MKAAGGAFSTLLALALFPLVILAAFVFAIIQLALKG